MNLHWATLYNLQCYINGLEIILHDIQGQAESALRVVDEEDDALYDKLQHVARVCERTSDYLEELRRLQDEVEELNNND